MARASHHEPGFRSALSHLSCFRSNIHPFKERLAKRISLPNGCTKYEELTEQLAVWSYWDTASAAKFWVLSQCSINLGFSINHGWVGLYNGEEMTINQLTWHQQQTSDINYSKNEKRWIIQYILLVMDIVFVCVCWHTSAWWIQMRCIRRFSMTYLMEGVINNNEEIGK